LFDAAGRFVAGGFGLPKNRRKTHSPSAEFEISIEASEWFEQTLLKDFAAHWE